MTKALRLDQPFVYEGYEYNFVLNKQYDQTKYWDRFRQNLSVGNPLLFFVGKKRIKQAQMEIE